jgi:protein SCO1/2
MSKRLRVVCRFTHLIARSCGPNTMIDQGSSGQAKSMNCHLLAVTALLLIVASLACSHRKTYPLQGEVRSKDTSSGEVMVSHGDIPGFMSAMTMPYRVKGAAVLQELQPGDKIAAEIVVSKDGNEYWLEDVRITDESGRGKVTPAAPSMLMEGEKVPDIPLVNQDGRTIHLSDFAGKAVLVTFIYTRCPVPTFCPRLSSQFPRIHNELKKNPGDYDKTHLLTISFDPKYDTPAVLRKYGLGYLEGDASGFSQWDFAGTKSAADLPRLAKAFGLEYEEQDNQIAHTMNIALIAPDGTVAKFWSTQWTGDELLKELLQTAHRPAKG